MSIQSTRYVTRHQAEELFIERYTELYRDRIEKEAKSFYTDEGLEDILETTFDNYKIVPEGNEDA